MSWWGKLVGGAFGYLIWAPWGALLGVALGHTFDKGLERVPEHGLGWDRGARERIQTAFFKATFSILGHVAKADGRVSPDEIQMAEAVMAEMELDTEKRRIAISLFDEGKAADFPLDDMLDEFHRVCQGRRTLIQMFMEIQLQAAYADRTLDDAEDRLLRYICARLGISEFEYVRLQRMIEAELHFSRRDDRGRRGHSAQSTSAPTLNDAYAVLGVDAVASDSEVKKAYRRMLSQHHPDKLVAKGLPEEMMRLATQKTREIKQAYEHIKEARKL